MVATKREGADNRRVRRHLVDAAVQDALHHLTEQKSCELS